MDNISAVRLKSSERSVLTKEVGIGNGTSFFWKLAHAPILTSPSDIQIRVNGTIVANYTVDYPNGVVTFNSAPAIDAEIEFTYYWSIFTDVEIQYFLDDSGGITDIAAAKVLLAIAADASKVALRESQAGGGGLGAVSIDTSVRARELRNTAQALITAQATIGANVPAEGLTEINWNEQVYDTSIAQRIIRDNP
jgi:hypothetical protein